MEKTIPERRDSRLEQFFLNELKDLYGTEQHQLQILPLLKKSSSSLKLRNVLANHLDDTREHIVRLELIFEKMGHVPEAHISEVMLAFTREAETVFAATEEDTATRDTGIVVVAQKLDHYEITSYGSICHHARTLELDDIEEILELTLYEEKESDDLLTALAENYINNRAGQ